MFSVGLFKLWFFSDIKSYI